MDYDSDRAQRIEYLVNALHRIREIERFGLNSGYPTYKRSPQPFQERQVDVSKLRKQIEIVRTLLDGPLENKPLITKLRSEGVLENGDNIALLIQMGYFPPLAMRAVTIQRGNGRYKLSYGPDKNAENYVSLMEELVGLIQSES